MLRIFPDTSVENRVRCATGLGSTKDFSTLISGTLPDLEMVSKGQCFPLYLYEGQFDNASAKANNSQKDMFTSNEQTSIVSQPIAYTRKDGICDAGLAHFQTTYAGESISKEDVFYYIYGLLHSPDYRERYADNLTKELPRILCVKTVADFLAFSKAGRALAELHLNYETVEP